ncbi:thiamine pyrophosphate-dependent dehydrogenase E1 component subunit alpha [Micromonospora sp. NPDC049051]|uniref:thiamine pyrophosphate-dependent dehydrogenase E1 component subunit alpha n=1 Tax=Micromonospora sp. NPDC049051 TaxID=3364264 RepID=UPI0037206A42
MQGGDAGVATEPAPPRLSDADLGRLLLIRRFEETLLRLFAAGSIAGTTHTCLGQEYIPVALAPLIANDHVFSNHRGHGHYLALHDDPEGLLAEILGRDGGICAGVGGSQHLRRERYLSTGVQGQSVPVAAGVALHLLRSRTGTAAVAFIGDGTWGEGAVYEGLNLARLWELPLVIIVENNGMAQSTPTVRQLAGSIAGRVRGFGIRHHLVSDRDTARIRADVAPLFAAARRGIPTVIEFVTNRLGPHSKGDDTRTAEEIAAVAAADWATIYRQVYPEQFDRIDAVQRNRVVRLTEDVKSRPLSRWTAGGTA